MPWREKKKDLHFLNNLNLAKIRLTPSQLFIRTHATMRMLVVNLEGRIFEGNLCWRENVNSQSASPETRYIGRYRLVASTSQAIYLPTSSSLVAFFIPAVRRRCREGIGGMYKPLASLLQMCAACKHWSWWWGSSFFVCLNLAPVHILTMGLSAVADR